jgi:predicted RNA-binding Zn ribbon-like protein
VSVSRTGTPDEGFSFRSGRLALDFAATLMFRGSEHPRELLGSPAMLAGWVLARGAVSSAAPCEVKVLREATRLREAIYRTAVAHIAGHPAMPGDITVLNHHGTIPPVAVALGPGGMITRSGTMPAVLATIARDAIELLGGPDATRLRQCGRSGCTRMFIDLSRGQNRTWCGMRECGNRVNAAAYRRRQRQRLSAGPR